MVGHPGGHGKSHIIADELNATLGQGNWLHYNSSWASCQRSGFMRLASQVLEGRCRRNAAGTAAHTSAGTPQKVRAIIGNAAAMGIERKGEQISPTEAQRIADFIFELMDEGHEIDLRSFFDHAVPSYLQWRHELGVDEIQDKLRKWGRDIPSKVVHWQDVVRSKIACDSRVEGREERLQRERLIACRCYKDGVDTDHRLRLWEKRTGNKRQAFYDRLKEAKEQGIFQRICG
jgi:hypothetical protein